MNAYSNTYKVQQIQTASREQILIMLYDGALRFLKLAKQACDDKQWEVFGNNMTKTQRIIMEFMSTLDREMGGEMADNLFRLYEYLHYRLIQANMKKDVAMIDEVYNHLYELKLTWEEAIRISSREAKTYSDPADQEVRTEMHAYSA